MHLAVVLISRNQEWNINRLIESVLDGTSCVSSTEIVLVDSASTDSTIDVACDYPISVLCLHPDQPLTAAAGRYVGYKYTTSELVLFLDGDMELCHGWVEEALQVILFRPDVAVVTGEIIDLPKTAGPDYKPPLKATDADLSIEVPCGRGAALYRRSILEQVGTFNPYIYSDEEPELCLRIRHAGYRILRLGHPIAYHYSDPAGRLSTLVGRWRRKLYLGPGQNLRYHMGGELFWSYLRERGYGIVPILALTIGLITFLWSFWFGQEICFNLWLLMLVVIIVIDAYRKHSLYGTIASLLERALTVDGTIRGFFLKPLDPDTYPAKLDVFKIGSPHRKHQHAGQMGSTSN
jgi:glycosyltransferase involved in cell wall biosynthesis